MRFLMPLMIAGAALAAMLASAPGCRAAAVVFAPGPYEISVSNDLRYATPAADLFNLCLPVAKAGQWNGPYPAVLIAHGGGWIEGNNFETNSQRKCEWFASYGIVAMNIDYRLITSGDPSTDWPAQVVDAQAAVRYLRRHASQYHVNTHVICGLGDSAGGQIVQYVAYYFGLIPGDITTENQPADSQLGCVVSEFGPSLFGPTVPPGAPPGETYTILKRDAGLKTPHTLLVQGTTDTIVPPINSQTIRNWLIGQDRPVAYISYVGGHEFDGLTSAQIQAIFQSELAYLIKEFREWGAYPKS